MRVKNCPESVIGTPLSKIDDFDWDECFPAVENGVVVGVVSAVGGSLAGQTNGFEYNADLDLYE